MINIFLKGYWDELILSFINMRGQVMDWITQLEQWEEWEWCKTKRIFYWRRDIQGSLKNILIRKDQLDKPKQWSNSINSGAWSIRLIIVTL